jgi:hypothetical protein
MKPYDEIRTDRLRSALAERKPKACCDCCAHGKPCAGEQTEAKKQEQDRSFVARLVDRLTGNP